MTRRLAILAAAFTLGAALLASCGKPPRAPLLPTDRQHGRTPVPTGGTEVRIGVWVDSGDVTVSSPGGFAFGQDGHNGQDITPIADTTLVVQQGRDAQAIHLQSDDGRADAATFTLAPRKPGGHVSVAGHAYHGHLEIFRGRRGGVTVVNVLPLEDYLRGVVPSELGHVNDSLLAAMEAQAVAARTYSLSYLGRHKEDGFDLLSTTADQVYDGIKGEYPTGDRAIQATRGIVARKDGALIRCNYFSTCGGKTADDDEVWSEAPISYLRARRDRAGSEHDAFCKGSRLYRWTEVWPADEFLDLVSSYGPQVFPRNGAPPGGELVAVYVRDRGPSHRVKDLEIRTRGGSYHLTGDRIRMVLRRPSRHDQILRSTLFSTVVRRSHGRIVEVEFDGGGYGHGVGMCQFGAIGMARAGYSMKQIIGHYYKGVELARLY